MATCKLEPDGEYFRCSVCGDPARLRHTVRTCRAVRRAVPVELPPVESKPRRRINVGVCEHLGKATGDKVKCGCPNNRELIYECGLGGVCAKRVISQNGGNEQVKDCRYCEDFRA